MAAAKKSVKVEPFVASSWSQPGYPTSRTFTYKTDAVGASSSTWQEDTWYLTGGTTWSSGKTTVYMRYGSDSGTIYAAIDVTGQGGAAPTITLVSAVATNGTRTGSAEDNRIYLDATANGQTTKQYFRLISTTYTNSSGSSRYCVDLHAGTDSSGRRIGRISVQGRYDSGYDDGYDVGYSAGKDDLTWSYTSAASVDTSEPSGTFAKSYAVSKGYNWAWFSITVNGHTQRVKIHMTS